MSLSQLDVSDKGKIVFGEGLCWKPLPLPRHGPYGNLVPLIRDTLLPLATSAADSTSRSAVSPSARSSSRSRYASSTDSSSVSYVGGGAGGGVGAVASANVQFTLTVKSTTSVGATNIQPGHDLAPPLTFQASFVAGPPERLSLLTPLPPAQHYRDGDKLPSFTVACWDRFGNRSRPKFRSEEWSVAVRCNVLDFGSGRKATIRPLNADGITELSDIVLAIPGGESIPLIGRDISLELKLLRKPVSLIVEDQSLFPDLVKTPACSIDIHMVPLRLPTCVKVRVFITGLFFS